jgi:hypothetical protein
MKWHSISEVAKAVKQSRQAVYKRLKRLNTEEKVRIGENLIDDGKLRLSDEGIKLLFEVSTNDNSVDEKVDTSVNMDVVTSLKNQLLAKEREVVRLDDILGKVLSQLDEERRLRGEERNRTDTLLMKFANDLSTFQKALEYKKTDSDTQITGKESAYSSLSQDRRADRRGVIHRKSENLKDPLENLTWYRRFWIELTDPEKLRRYNS